ncbi:precorrin-3B C17-methyltransferase [Lachnospiraceae bacterium JC7]|nr:precorrin-3B C17-methyltransferase [Lachnospiraceae bacterium JC7]
MGTVYAVGFGPGDIKYETLEAREILSGVDVIVGYKTYADILKKQYPEKEFFVSGMREEEKRCEHAMDLAVSGKNVAVISSGDAAVYGMAGLLYEMSEKEKYKGVQVITVPGLSAVLSGSAVLGAPVGHDFCVISLSDLLTPWEVIEKRLRAAAEGDFVIVIYNPVSHKRHEQFKRACEILGSILPKDTVTGYVRNIGRDGCRSRIFLLHQLEGLGNEKEQPEIDMLTTIFIGNSTTKVIETPDGPRMVTPRGYRL